MRARVLGTLRSRRAERVLRPAPRSMRSIVLLEKRSASPVVGCFHDLPASLSMRWASSPGSGEASN